ncbi:tyrosine-type recombinase/integrase [Streptomyces sp. RKAG293]|uniref:tyrosine-type recombinase/integrase n=1 Tax=Streptomyces sp. RKAG293 TaxID=2893403 RepID=UPI0035A83ED2
MWTVTDAVHFLHHCHTADPAFADLIEVLIGSGLRKGEALALRWDDIHLNERVLYVRYTLSAVDNNRLVITAPKTPSSSGSSPPPTVWAAPRTRPGRRCV